MRSAMVFSLALSALSCGARPAAPPAPPAPVASATPTPAPATVSGCLAKPSTLYGTEPLVFELTGEPSANGAPIAVEVVDQRGESVFRGASAVPGTVSAGTPPSGDFSLKIAGSAITCRATVNRELTRGTSDAR